MNERHNLYFINCSKHGSHYSSYDECGKCLEEQDEMDRASIPSSICWGCVFCQEEPGHVVFCQYNPKFRKLAQTPRKKHCKYFWEEGKCRCGEYFEHFNICRSDLEPEDYQICLNCGKPYLFGSQEHRNFLLQFILNNLPDPQFIHAASSSLQQWRKKAIWDRLRQIQSYYFKAIRRV